MKIQLLPSTIDENGMASVRQHLLTMVIDDLLAIDAGCLALSCSDLQRSQIRDILLTHTHLDHIAGLPLFVDDLFASLTGPIRVHATREMIDILERDLFNWSIYPRFSELSNDNGPVMEYHEFVCGDELQIEHIAVQSVRVNHKVSALGYIVSDGTTTVGITGDTAETDEFWRACNEAGNMAAVFVECAFPNRLESLAIESNHLTPSRLNSELAKLDDPDLPVFVINLKPMYRDEVRDEISRTSAESVQILNVGPVYTF
jgi:cAMP phosphodiesterase